MVTRVEIRIPFKSLRYPGGEPQSWGFNVTRVVQRTGYTDTWTDVRRANASFIGQEGAIGGLHDLEARRGGRGPALRDRHGGRQPGRRPSGDFTRDDVNPDAGLNLRLGFTSYALDATLNPDFSQVESDEGQVTVNERFALFFPEKRPFFLEGIELFGSPQTLVYTRRIVNPKAGAKLTGKFGQLGVAHLTAVDETDAGDAWFNITRLRRDFGRNSIAGVTFTNRDRGSLHNRVLAGDFRYVWGLYYTQVQLGASVTHDAAGSRTAPIWQAEYDRTGRSWGFNYLVKGLGAGFDDQAGFVNRLRSDVVNAHAFNRLTMYGARGAALENLTVFFGPDRTWLYRGFDFNSALEGYEQLDATFQLRGGWELNGHIERDFVNFQDSTYADYTVGSPSGPAYAPADDFSGFVWRTRVTTPTWQQMEASVQYQRGRAAIFEEGGTGKAWILSGELGLRPASTIRVALTGTVFRLLPPRRPRVRPHHHSAAQGGVPAAAVALLPRHRRVPLPAPGGADRPGQRGAAPGRRRDPARDGVQRAPGRPAGVVRADAGDGGVPRVRQLARDRRRIQLVAAGAAERRVLREAGVSGAPVSLPRCAGRWADPRVLAAWG